MTEQTGSIDYAIEKCENTISRHKLQSTFFLTLILVIPTCAGLYFYSNKNYKSLLIEKILYNSKLLDSKEFLNILNDDKSNFILYALLLLIFGVFTSLYRFHLKEIAKYEHYLLGFLRIRIAANNSVQGFDSEVRQSLTQDAFTYENKPTFINKEKRIESPIPGYPTSDLSTGIINKVLDSIEIVTKKK